MRATNPNFFGCFTSGLFVATLLAPASALPMEIQGQIQDRPASSPATCSSTLDQPPALPTSLVQFIRRSDTGPIDWTSTVDSLPYWDRRALYLFLGRFQFLQKLADGNVVGADNRHDIWLWNDQGMPVSALVNPLPHVSDVEAIEVSPESIVVVRASYAPRPRHVYRVRYAR